MKNFISKIFSRFFGTQSVATYTSSAPMAIEDFVYMSIRGIMTGIQKAQQEYSGENSAFAPLICPAWAPPLSDIGGSAKGHADKIHDLEFDLAITVKAGTVAGGKAEIGVIAGVEGKLLGTLENHNDQATINRIRFKIPIRYPLAELGKPDWNPLEKPNKLAIKKDGG
jgi:hypothetical protein